MPFNLPELDYLTGDFSDTIKKGQLVKIPFRNKSEYGMVKELLEDWQKAPIKLKKISEIVFKQPVVSPGFLDFIAEMSEFYHVSPGFLLKTSLFPIKKTKMKLVEKKLKDFSIDKLSLPGKPCLDIYNNFEEKIESIKKTVKKGGQVLILVPQIEKINELAAALKKEKISVLTLSGSDGEKKHFDLWLKVRSNDKAVVVGTRKAVFLPWINLQNIVLTEEADPDYKSFDMAPRYHARDALLMLAKHTGAKLNLLCHTPSVESYYFAQEKVYESQGGLEKLNTPPIFVDAAKARRAGGGFLDEEILEEISNCQQDVFVKVNRRGASAGIICKDCGHIFRCSGCRRPLAYYEKDNVLRCRFCRQTSSPAISCPICHGPNCKEYGFGTEKVAKEIYERGNKNVIVLDADNPKVITKIAGQKKKIIVGTDFALKYLDWKNIEVFVFSDPDNTMAMPEFRVTENLWLDLRQAQFNLPPTAKFYIQTSHVERHVYQGLYNPAIFYQTELAERSAFAYPPRYYLARLLFAGRADETDRQAKKLWQNLSDLTRQLGDVKIFGPLPAAPEFYRGQHWRIIVLKLSYKNYKERMKEILKIVPEKWKVDPNPTQTLSIN